MEEGIRNDRGGKALEVTEKDQNNEIRAENRL